MENIRVIIDEQRDLFSLIGSFDFDISLSKNGINTFIDSNALSQDSIVYLIMLCGGRFNSYDLCVELGVTFEELDETPDIQYIVCINIIKFMMLRNVKYLFYITFKDCQLTIQKLLQS